MSYDKLFDKSEFGDFFTITSNTIIQLKVDNF